MGTSVAKQRVLPLDRAGQRLHIVNKVFLPFLRTSRKHRRLLRILGKYENPAFVVQRRDYTANILAYTMPAGPQLVVALYASMQSTRPLSPQQLASRLRSLKEAVASLRGRLFNQADIVYLIYAPAGFTRGAKRLAVKQAVTIAPDVETLLASLARYIKTRYERLRRKLAGKRIWGHIPLLLYALGYLASELGADVRLPPIEATIDALTRGAILVPS